MNLVQLSIVAVIAIIILAVIGYFWFQEAKFKKIVENNFNQRVNDAIATSQDLVMDGTPVGVQAKSKNVVEKDIVNFLAPESEQFNTVSNAPQSTITVTQPEEDFPEDSVEALFAALNKIPFPFAHEIDSSLDYIVNIAFEQPLKIKVLPDVASYTQKHYRIFVLDSENRWHIHEKTNKHNTLALKVVVSLLDRSGVINQAQLENLYKELFKFTMHHQGFIEQPNYEQNIAKISDQVKFLGQSSLELELFLVLKQSVDYTNLTNFLTLNSFKKIDGKFHYIENGVTQYVITDEDGGDIIQNGSYSLLRIVSSLHFLPAPKTTVDNIFDFVERFMEKFESRVLTTSRQLFGEREYNTLMRHVQNYVSNAQRHQIELGGELIKRLL